MNERKKIIIQTGSETDDSLSTPHFDAEATLTARPVVPLAEGAAAVQGYDPPRLRTGKSWNPWLLVLIVVGAVGLGVATGLAIGFYKNRQTSASPVATEATAPAPDISAGRTVEQPAPTPLPTQPAEEEAARASVPEVVEEPSVKPKDEKPERAARDDERRADDEDRKATPPVVTEKRRARDDEVIAEDNEEARRVERQRRREERRERRRRERDLEEPAEFPRDIERAGRGQINRIRDIFEGRQP
jgi:hypothetical protein